MHKPITLAGGLTLSGNSDAIKIAADGSLSRDNRITSLVALSGVDSSATHLSTFEKGIIADNANVKEALQDLETNLDTANHDIGELDTRVGKLSDLHDAFHSPSSAVGALSVLQSDHSALYDFVGTGFSASQTPFTAGNTTVVSAINTAGTSIGPFTNGTIAGLPGFQRPHFESSEGSASRSRVEAKRRGGEHFGDSDQHHQYRYEYGEYYN